MKTDRDNLLRLAAALRQLNARLRVSGLDDQESAALPVQIDGILVTIASLSAIVASKEFANRPKDRDALPELHLLQERMRGA